MNSGPRAYSHTTHREMAFGPDLFEMALKLVEQKSSSLYQKCGRISALLPYEVRSPENLIVNPKSPSEKFGFMTKDLRQQDAAA